MNGILKFIVYLKKYKEFLYSLQEQNEMCELSLTYDYNDFRFLNDKITFLQIGSETLDTINRQKTNLTAKINQLEKILSFLENIDTKSVDNIEQYGELLSSLLWNSSLTDKEIADVLIQIGKKAGGKESTTEDILAYLELININSNLLQLVKKNETEADLAPKQIEIFPLSNFCNDLLSKYLTKVTPLSDTSEENELDTILNYSKIVSWLEYNRSFISHKIFMVNLKHISNLLLRFRLDSKNVFNIIIGVIWLNIKGGLLSQSILNDNTPEEFFDMNITIINPRENSTIKAGDINRIIYRDLCVEIRNSDKINPCDLFSPLNKEMLSLAITAHRVIEEHYFKKINVFDENDINEILIALKALSLNTSLLEKIKEYLYSELTERKKEEQSSLISTPEKPKIQASNKQIVAVLSPIIKKNKNNRYDLNEDIIYEKISFDIFIRYVSLLLYISNYLNGNVLEGFIKNWNIAYIQNADIPSLEKCLYLMNGYSISGDKIMTLGRLYFYQDYFQEHQGSTNLYRIREYNQTLADLNVAYEIAKESKQEEDIEELQKLLDKVFSYFGERIDYELELAGHITPTVLEELIQKQIKL